MSGLPLALTLSEIGEASLMGVIGISKEELGTDYDQPRGWGLCYAC